MRVKEKKNGGQLNFFPLSPVFQKNKGRIVTYASGAVHRTGRIIKILTAEDDTPRPPKILYECFDPKKKTTKQYVNNPSMLRVEEEEEEGSEEEGGGEGEGEANH